MERDNITKDSKDQLFKGVQKVADILRPTYGPAGSNVIVQTIEFPYYRVTNDAKVIIDSMVLANPIEQAAKNIIGNATSLAEKDSGDGRKTTALLTEAIMKEGVSIKADPMELSRSLNQCIPIIFKEIDKNKKDITVDEVSSVASISAENTNTGLLVQEIYQKIGKDGIIEIDTSNLPDTFYTITEGVRIRAGYLGRYSETEEGKAVYKDPVILISKEKISSVDQLEMVLKFLKSQGKNELVMYVEDIDMSVASRLALTHMQGGFKTLIIKAPVLWKDWIYEDFAKLVGATPIDLKEGKTFKNITFEDFGKCDKIICTKDETRIIGTRDISQHIKKLDELSLVDDQQKVRISWLQTKIAILKVGGNSEIEIGYNLKKARDACSSAYWALREGVVKGAGVDLYMASLALPDTIGGSILKKALKVPYFIICNSMKIDVFDFVPNSPTDDHLYAFDEKVVDAAIVVKNAVKNAISIAGTNLTSGNVITLPKVNTLQPNFPIQA